jgi:hypothetical protein
MADQVRKSNGRQTKSKQRDNYATEKYVYIQNKKCSTPRRDNYTHTELSGVVTNQKYRTRPQRNGEISRRREFLMFANLVTVKCDRNPTTPPKASYKRKPNSSIHLQ